MVRTLETSSYLSIDQTIENIHPYVFAAKLLTYNENTPTYKDTLKLTDDEKQL